MEVSYFEECGEKSVHIRKERTAIAAKVEECEDKERSEAGERRHKRDRKRIVLRVHSAGGDDCESVGVSLEACFSCKEWERLICELQRVNCYGDCCEPYDYDDCFEPERREDDCDDERVVIVEEPAEREPVTVCVSVEELRKAIKGLSATDVVEISE